MTIKFHEMKAIVDSYDSTKFDSMEIEFGKAKENVASLELKNSKLVNELNEYVSLISSMNDEIKKLDQNIIIYESKTERLENELASLKKEKAMESSVASVSPSCEQNLFNDRVKTLELENLKLNEIIKNFTRSQTSLNK